MDFRFMSTYKCVSLIGLIRKKRLFKRAFKFIQKKNMFAMYTIERIFIYAISWRNFKSYLCKGFGRVVIQKKYHSRSKKIVFWIKKVPWNEFSLGVIENSRVFQTVTSDYMNSNVFKWCCSSKMCMVTPSLNSLAKSFPRVSRSIPENLIIIYQMCIKIKM